MLPTALEYPSGIEMVFDVYRPARGGRSCEHFGGYKTMNRIHLLFVIRVWNAGNVWAIPPLSSPVPHQINYF